MRYDYTHSGDWQQMARESNAGVTKHSVTEGHRIVGEVVHTTKVKVQKDAGKDKTAYIENFPEPVRYGLHGGVKRFFKIDAGADLPTTLDHLVAAVGSCMAGTLGGALEGRGIPSYPGKISADVEGTIENIDGKPLLTRVHVKYTLKVPRGKTQDAERAVEVHDKGCAAAQSVKRGFTIDFEAVIEEE